jgi:tetratricopeptide (TPR) repeat protein
MFAVVVILLVLLGAGAERASAESPRDDALALLARYHEDPARIDRARELLQAALQRERRVETMVTLAKVYLLTGDVRARSAEDKLTAYEQGREIGKRAIELAPKSEEAHLWYVANTGRWGQTKGVVRSLFLLPTMREELGVILELNPRSAPGHAIAGSLAFEVPGLFGGDRTKAEDHFRKALEIDPHYTLPRVDLARLLIAGGRQDDARRELRRVLEERTPTSLADWTVKDVPRARQILDSIADRR